MKGKFLIVTSDDFGLDPAVNEAVRQANLNGILTAASLMVAGPAAAEAATLAATLPTLRVGLHLVLADGRSVLPVRLIPDLVDSDGRFAEGMLGPSLRFAISSRVRAQLAAEIRAQFEAFARTGLALDHVNAHKHFHLHPIVLELMVRIGAEFGAFAVRVPQEPLGFARRMAGVAGAAGAAALVPWLARMRGRLSSSGVLYNDQVFGIACSGRFDRATLLAILASLPAGVTEIYMHPAVATERPIAQSMSAYRHADELAALLDPDVIEARSAAQTSYGGYTDLRRLTGKHNVAISN